MLTQKLQLLSNQISACTKCTLHLTKTNYVISRGNPHSKLMICAEAPGFDEDQQGFPLVGVSGKLLDKAIIELGYDLQQDIFVVNILKCRPPNNRKPTQEECDTCIDYLEQQINIVNPSVIIALGNTAVENLINTTFGITKIHGKIFKRNNILVVPAYHPSFILRNGGSLSSQYQEFLSDLKTAFVAAYGEKNVSK